MTPEQIVRQDMQVKWLELALRERAAAARALPDIQTASLAIKGVQ